MFLIVYLARRDTLVRDYGLFNVNDHALCVVLMDTNAFYKLTVCSRLREKTRGFSFDLRQARRGIDRNSIRSKLICSGGRQVIRALVICRTGHPAVNNTRCFKEFSYLFN